jgi:hypothetical protein
MSKNRPLDISSHVCSWPSRPVLNSGASYPSKKTLVKLPSRSGPLMADFVAEVRCKLFWLVIPSL